MQLLRWHSDLLHAFPDASVARDSWSTWYDSSYVLNLTQAQAQVERIGVTDQRIRLQFCSSKGCALQSAAFEIKLNQSYHAVVVELLAKYDEYHCGLCSEESSDAGKSSKCQEEL